MTRLPYTTPRLVEITDPAKIARIRKAVGLPSRQESPAPRA